MIQLHLVPLLLGVGRRLFEQLSTEPVIEAPGVTRLRYRVVK